ncbi:MAG: KpsF/GutQ family sugar-phosphate isomerase [Caulobacterales bacterium]
MTDNSSSPAPSAAAIARRVLRLEADALAEFSESPPADFAKAVDVLLELEGRVIVAGVGKSGHVARKIAATLASTGTPAMFVHPTEASHGDLGMITPHDAVIALSKSGETRELSDIVQFAKRFAIPLIGMTAKADSALGQQSDMLLLTPDAAEACDETSAPTTSTTLMMALGDALAVALLEKRGFTAQDFHVFHPGGSLGAMLKTVRDLMHGADELPLVPAGSAMKQAAQVMSDKKFGCIGIVDAQGKLAGVITDGDLRRHLGPSILDLTVDQVMTANPMTVAPETLASAALKLINERKITQLFVLDGDRRPAGLIHVHDFLKAGVM